MGTPKSYKPFIIGYPPIFGNSHISRPQKHHRTREPQPTSSQPTGLRAKTLRALAPTSGATLRDGMGLDVWQDIGKPGLPPTCQVVVEEKEVPLLETMLFELSRVSRCLKPEALTLSSHQCKTRRLSNPVIGIQNA